MAWYKRPFDLTILLVAHVCLAPVWLFLWTAIPAAVWLGDRGPVFYRQPRVGVRGQTFEAIKFRTMRPDAERQTGPVWASANDPRVTPIGRILRKTALDELPQVINILRGDMSLVGPRSERPELHERFVAEVAGFEDRLAVKPGLTGMAQIRGAYDLSPAEKLKFDLQYIDQMSPLLDMRILIMSVVNTVTGRWDRREGTAPAPRSKAQ
jgi:lipopolysaccharide/colanic/teichoic acid biosynthesis glycosyltransferase